MYYATIKTPKSECEQIWQKTDQSTYSTDYESNIIEINENEKLKFKLSDLQGI